MYECANHHPESSGYTAKTMCISNGYLQFRYKKNTKNAEALYWSNIAPTAKTIAGILALGHEAGFEEIGFSFRIKYRNLFLDFHSIIAENRAEDEIELERRTTI